MPKKFATPGVYIEEKSAFTNPVVAVPTAIPAFIGYTEKAIQNNKDLRNRPVRISSFVEYQQYFGGAPDQQNPPVFLLYYSLQLFYANGGSECYIVSVGDYSHPPALADFDAGASDVIVTKGLGTLLTEPEPTLLVIPDAVSLGEKNCSILQQKMLAHCGQTGSRFAILDVLMPMNSKAAPDTQAIISTFRAGIGANNLQWGAAYYPWFYTNLPGIGNLLLPPSGAIAGIYCLTDNTRGVSQAPANVSVASATKLAVNLTDQMQGDLNVPLDGKAVNALRNFPGNGILVWGARTLDGNSDDWRYVSVRRTVIFIEQSIKNAIKAFVFEQNNASTWTSVKAVISDFLMNTWQSGALAGPTAKDAFNVNIGLGSTMTNQDISDGIMRVTVLVAVSRPAEFIVLTFEQKMQGV